MARMTNPDVMRQEFLDLWDRTPGLRQLAARSEQGPGWASVGIVLACLPLSVLLFLCLFLRHALKLLVTEAVREVRTGWQAGTAGRSK